MEWAAPCLTAFREAPDRWACPSCSFGSHVSSASTAIRLQPVDRAERRLAQETAPEPGFVSRHLSPSQAAGYDDASRPLLREVPS